MMFSLATGIPTRQILSLYNIFILYSECDEDEEARTHTRFFPLLDLFCVLYVRVVNFTNEFFNSTALLAGGARFGCFAFFICGAASHSRINEGHKNSKHSGMSTNIFAANPLLLFCMMLHVACARCFLMWFAMLVRVLWDVRGGARVWVSSFGAKLFPSCLRALTIFHDKIKCREFLLSFWPHLLSAHSCGDAKSVGIWTRKFCKN